MIRKIVLLASLLVVAGPVLADTPQLDQREQRQAERIRSGWETGELTRSETAGLMQGQAQLRRMEHRVKSDGVVTNQERARLHQQTNAQSRQIRRQRHDGQSRN